jgi:hypothetical protein
MKYFYVSIPKSISPGEVERGIEKELKIKSFDRGTSPNNRIDLML